MCESCLTERNVHQTNFTVFGVVLIFAEHLLRSVGCTFLYCLQAASNSNHDLLQMLPMFTTLGMNYWKVSASSCHKENVSGEVGNKVTRDREFCVTGCNSLTLEEAVCCYTILDCCVVPRLAEKVTIAARIALY
jgi:hypothetical protein